MPIDMSAAKAPPRKRAVSAVKSTTPVDDASSITRQRAEGLMGIGQLLQGGCIMMGQIADAGAIGKFYPPVAMELANCAERSEVIAKVADVLIQVGPWSALITAVLPLAMQLMANHKLVNPAMLAGQGVVHPEVLQSEMETQMIRIQAEALRQQQKAAQEARDAREDMQRLLATQAT